MGRARQQSRAALRPIADVDLAIVGNGAIGCALALRFVETHPDAKVALVGSSARTGSASLAAGAMLNVFAEVDEMSLASAPARAKLALAREASRSWPGHLERLNARLAGTGIPTVELRWGTRVVGEDAGSPALAAIVAALREHGEPFEHEDERTLFLPAEGMVRSRDLHRAYDAAFAREPAVAVVDADAESLALDGEAKILATSAGSVRAPRVVLAAGVRTQGFVDRLGLASRVPRLVAGVGVAVVARAAPPPVVVRYVGGPYLVPWDDGHVYVGATNDPAAEGTTAPPPGAVAWLTRAAERVLGPVPIVDTLVGWRPTTLDGYPLLGPLSVPGVWLATGTKRDGLHASPRIAEELVRCLASGETPFGGIFQPERALLAPPSPDLVAFAS